MFLARAASASIALAAAAVLLSAPRSAALAETNLVFGAYTSDQPSELVAQLRPTLDLIARRLSAAVGDEVRIKMQVMRSYEEGVKLIVEKRADFMRVGPASYVKAHEQDPGISILAVESLGGRATFNGVICVHQQSDIVDINQLRGRSFAFGSPDSTLGRYFAQQRLLEVGIRATDLARYEYLDRHDKVGAAVGARLYDAGALEETVFTKLVAGGTPIRAIATFPNATRPWIARSDLDPVLLAALRQVLLSIDDAAALKQLRFDGFVRGTDAHYEPTRRAIAQNHRF